MAFYIFLGFTILWFLFMTYLSHQDGEHTGRTSRELAEKLSFLDSDINILNGRLRRLAHVVVYAVLTVLLAITLKLGGYSPWLRSAPLSGPGPMKQQSRWCKAAIFLGLMLV